MVNLGIQILRSILCFWIICYHCLNDKKINYLTHYITKKKRYHVPCFCFISFFFSYNIFSDRNIIKFKKRIERLLISYVLWPLIIMFFEFFTFNNSISFRKYIVQIILGTKFIVPHWYLFSMITSSIFIFIISIIFKINFLYVIQLIAVFTIGIQYSYVSRILKFVKKYEHSVKFTILHSLGAFPIFVFGLTISSIKIIEILRRNRWKVIFFSYIIIFYLFKYNIFKELYGYNGVVPCIISFFFFLGFYLLPLENTFTWIQITIEELSNYTNGIYCMHQRINLLFIKKLHLSGNLKTVVMIYLLSYLLSFFGMKVFGKTKLKYLFI